MSGYLFEILISGRSDDLRRYRVFPLVPQQELRGVRHVKAGGHRHHVLRPRHCRRLCGRSQSSPRSEVDNLYIRTAGTVRLEHLLISIMQRSKKTPQNSYFLEGKIFQYF